MIDTIIRALWLIILVLAIFSVAELIQGVM
jgi:hypothetical protein